jgi:tRNA (Thr-GGU) A37 N-methylase
LLDIKPYVPRFDHLSAERTGWLQQTSDRPPMADRRFET